MYLSFYGLHKKPFEVSTDPSFLWLGEKHKEALATLKYGNLGNQGIILLTGDVGTGKTTLINALINSLGDEVIVARVPDPGMAVIDFMNYISHAFGMKKSFATKDAFLIHFDQFLNSTHAAGKKCLLIIDEAQRLSPALLEEVRQLSNIEKQETKLLSIFFVGQNEFNDVLLEDNNRALRQRISLNYVIEPLDLHETGEFIRHRLHIAGAENDIFSPEAIRKVYEFSGGFPRRVNIICDHSLLLGFGGSAKTITGEIVEECARDLLLPGSSKNQKSEPLQAVAIADSENLPAPPSEHIQEVNARNDWKTFSIFALIALAVLIITYIMFPGEYRDFFSRYINKEVQSYSGEREGGTISANSHSEPAPETASAGGIGTNTETTVTDKAASKVVVVQKPPPQVAEVKPDSTVSADDKPDLPEKTPVVPALTDKEAKVPGDGNTPKTPAVAEPDASKQPVATVIPEDPERASPHPVDQKNQTVDQVTESSQPISEGTLTQELETEPGQGDPQEDEEALQPEIPDQSSGLADEEAKTTTVPDNLASDASDETERKRVEAEKTVAEVPLKTEQQAAPELTNDRIPEPAAPAQAVKAAEPAVTDETADKEPEDRDPGALIDWVIKKRPK